jgi:hypothetical protein
MARSDFRKLVCSSCKHENEPERVYCHNCGEKLDRSLLPTASNPNSEEELRKQKKVRRMMNPNRLDWLITLRKFVLLVGFAALVAAVFLAVQTPEDVPPAKSNELASGDSKLLWRQMMNSAPPAALMFKEGDINHSLRTAIKAETGPLGIKLERAFITLKPGSITLGTERNAWGLPLFSGVTFNPELVSGKWSPGITQLNIGRLRIHPAAAKLSGFILQPFTKAFEAEVKQFDRLAKIETGDKVITLTTKAVQ